MKIIINKGNKKEIEIKDISINDLKEFDKIETLISENVKNILQDDAKLRLIRQNEIKKARKKQLKEDLKITAFLFVCTVFMTYLLLNYY